MLPIQFIQAALSFVKWLVFYCGSSSVFAIILSAVVSFFKIRFPVETPRINNKTNMFHCMSFFVFKHCLLNNALLKWKLLTELY